MNNRAVFLDKDGTLIHDIPYNVDPERMTLTPNAAAGLQLLARHGYALIVVSNQSGVALGYFREPALAAVERRLQSLCAGAGVELSGFYYCPHASEGHVPAYSFECTCRKPAPGLVVRAACEHYIDLERSWLVGDILDDVEAGRRAGCKTVLLTNGNETEWRFGPLRRPNGYAGDLLQAAQLIVGQRARWRCALELAR